MNRDFIKMRDMMRSMMSGLPFDITFVTFDKARKKGGKVKKLKGAKLLWVENKAGKDVVPNHIPEELNTKKPNHHLHGTINVRMTNMDIHKVRKIFITHYNGMEVLL